MAIKQERLRGWRLAINQIAATRGASWLFSHILHHVDRTLLRLSNGRYSATGIFTGLPVVTLTTTGARSRLPRSLPLVGLEDGDKVVLIASNFGRSRHPAWYHNLRANPEATLSLRIAREHTSPARRRLPSAKGIGARRSPCMLDSRHTSSVRGAWRGASRSWC